MKNILFSILLFFSFMNISGAQVRSIDSLRNALSSSRQDTDRLKLYTRISSAYLAVRPDSFYFYCTKSIQLARQLSRKKELVENLLKMASALTDTGNYEMALKYANESLSIAKETGSRHLLINSYLETGRIYDFQSIFTKSIEYFYKSLELARNENNHEKIALIGTNLAADYFNEGDLKQAEEYSIMTLKEAKIANAPVHIYKALYILGMIKVSGGDTASGRDYYRQAIEVCDKSGYQLNKAEVLDDLAAIEMNSAKKRDLLLQVRKTYDSLSPSSFASRINWENLGSFYLKEYERKGSNKDLLREAERCFTIFLEKSKAANDAMSIAQAFQGLSQVDSSRGDYKSAFINFRNYQHIQDSIFSQDNKNKIAALQNQREMEKKNLEIESQKSNLREQKKNLLFSLAGLVSLIIVGILLYRLSFVRKQKNIELTLLNERLDSANSAKARLFGILSHDLRSPIANLVNFLRLQSNHSELITHEIRSQQEKNIRHSALSLLDVMEGLLLWSKGQMDHFKPEKTQVPVDRLFSSLKDYFSLVNNIRFAYDWEEGLLIHTDENYLRTILYNLTQNAVNALKNTNDAFIAWKAWKEGNRVFFSIRDNGAGMTEKHLRRFEENGEVTSSKYGLGLHIIQEMSAAIGCSLTAQSSDSGTSVMLELYDPLTNSPTGFRGG